MYIELHWKNSYPLIPLKGSKYIFYRIYIMLTKHIEYIFSV